MVLKLSDPGDLYNRLLTSNTAIIGSCNGLLCLYHRRSYKVNDAIFGISNPITGESINYIPTPISKEMDYPVHHGFGFGFSPISGVYKIVVFISNLYRNPIRKRSLYI